MPTLDFKGKQIVYAQKSLPSKDHQPSLDDNLIIHGDNLHALKALMPRYAGRVHCIYIDPPYNTGNEGWLYNDNVNSPLMQAWLTDKSPVDGEDLERHDKWLCMMWPRLHLLRELLAEDGVIFVSIDDNEQHHLRMMMDEIFGAENFVATVIWQKIFSPKNSAKYFSEDHDFILVYAKDLARWTPNTLERGEQAISRYKNPDNDPRGVWSSSDLTARNYYSQGTYEVTSPSGAKFKPSVGNYFRVSPEKFASLDKDGRIWWGPNHDNMPRLKRYLSDVKKGVVPQTFWSYEDVGHTQEAKKELVSVLEFEKSEDVFNTAKPTRLIKRILQIATDKNSIVLDSFAGSGTTALAVLALNAEDGGNRKFILVECEDYADTITAERVRRVIGGVPKAKDENLKNGLGGSFTLLHVGDEISPEKMLTGENLPDYDTLARHLVYTATGHAPDTIRKARSKDGLFHETDDRLFYLIYQPDLAFLRSADSALNGDRAERIAKQAKTKHKTAVVFATHKFMGQKELTDMGIVFCGLPYEISGIG